MSERVLRFVPDVVNVEVRAGRRWRAHITVREPADPGVVGPPIDLTGATITREFKPADGGPVVELAYEPDTLAEGTFFVGQDAAVEGSYDVAVAVSGFDMDVVTGRVGIVADPTA